MGLYRLSMTVAPLRSMGRAVVLASDEGGRYPHGHSMVVEGSDQRVLIDPSLTVAASDPLPGIDRLLISHAHEDHLAGVFRYPGAPIHAHAADVDGLQSLDGLMAVYGMAAATEARWRKEVVDRFHFVARPDATAFHDGDRFEIGGATLQAIHLPGHTSGHSAFLLEPDGVLFLADIDLSSFGPYYGDASSSVDAFERSLLRCRDLEARWYVTFHHKGVIESHAAFLRLLDDYTAVIGRRERALADWLVEPHTLEEIVAHRFVYRPHVTLLFVDPVERRSAVLHLERLLARGEVVEVEPGRFARVERSGRR
jgi:glyoxylase-like metal-dependent hydrolase (beta-lactamase superfamily II)